MWNNVKHSGHIHFYYALSIVKTNSSLTWDLSKAFIDIHPRKAINISNIIGGLSKMD